MDAPAPLSSPRIEYTRRLESRRMESARLDRRFRTLGNFRLLVAVAFAAIAWFSIARSAVTPWLLVIPALTFVVLLILSERAAKARGRANRAIAFYELGFCRLDDCWAGRGETGERFRDSAHPYAEDLDLFGKGGLFELLCTARTRMGEEKLARWLLAPASADEIRERQSAVEELRPALNLREDLALLGEDVRAGVNPEELSAWALGHSVGPPLPPLSAVRIVAAILVVLLLLALAAWGMFGLPPIFVLAVLFLEGVLGLRLRSAIAHVVQAVERPSHDLALLSAVLKRLESEPFTSPRLLALRQDLNTGGRPP